MARVHAAVAVAVLALWACKDRDTRTLPEEPGTDGGGVVVIPECPPACDPAPADEIDRSPSPNPIPGENDQPGDPGWRGGRGSATENVELYASTDSLFAGEALKVKVSTSAAMDVRAEVYRIGWYGGAGARKVWSGGPYAAHQQAACPMAPDTGLIECAWSDTFEVPTGRHWVSGLYVVKVIRPDGYRRFTPFVIRDRRQAEVVYGFAFNTYQAYNAWGGESLYSDASGTMPSGRAFWVSYDRPYLALDGFGKLFDLELSLVTLMERHGYDVSYVSNLDFVRFKDLIEDVPVFVHGSQDEYWNVEQRDQVDRALAAGKTSLAYFGGNGAYWKTRVLPSARGAAHRILACYKGDPRDPIPGSTARFRDPPGERPENGLFGVMYDGWQLIGFPLVVRDPTHWIFQGTSLQAGEQLPGLVGFEYDRTFDNGFSPAGLRVAFESPVVSAEGIPGRSHGVDRTLPSGTIVFAAGTIWWPLGLTSDPELGDPRVVRMTLNVLERAVSHVRSPRTPVVTGTPPAPTPPIPRWASSVATLAGVAGRAGWTDGPADQARFNGPTGLAVSPAGELAVADTGNNLVRVIGTDADRTVRTVAGNSLLGYRDGAGVQAMFRRPTGVAYAPDGAIYVADSDNHVIRRIAPDAESTVSTYAGVPRSQGSNDGAAAQARFRRPTALAIDAGGNLYVADQAGNRIRRIDAQTHEVTTVAGGSIGHADAADPLQARFNNPSALAIGPGGELYVFDSGNQRVRRIAPPPSRAVETIAGSPANPFGYADGTGLQARFRSQLGMTIDDLGELLIADSANFRLRKVVPGADAASTAVYTVAGSGRLGTADGTGATADLAAPTGLVAMSGARVAVADSFHHVIRLVER